LDVLHFCISNRGEWEKIGYGISISGDVIKISSVVGTKINMNQYKEMNSELIAYLYKNMSLVSSRLWPSGDNYNHFICFWRGNGYSCLYIAERVKTLQGESIEGVYIYFIPNRYFSNCQLEYDRDDKAFQILRDARKYIRDTDLLLCP
jgi:hypothetical protein